tara:strand:- start:117 stop:1259 length:1143 start_codon:yes stop_codon:yes gene_type:complete
MKKKKIKKTVKLNEKKIKNNILKKSLILFFALLIIIFLISITIQGKFNVNKLLSDFEKQTGLSIELKEESNLLIYPKIYFFNDNATISHESSSILIRESNLKITKTYWPFSPFYIDLKSPVVIINGLEINNFSIQANYNNKIINFEKLTGNLVGGKIAITGNVILTEQIPFNIEGSFSNIALNNILQQSGIPIWDRLTIKLSSKNFNISGYAKNKNNLISSLKGDAKLTGSGYLITTDEERFGAALLSLLVEKLPSIYPMSNLFNFIISTYGNIPTFIKGNLNINDSKIILHEINFENEMGKSLLNANLNLKSNNIDGKILFYENNQVFIETSIKGHINDPEILIGGKVFGQDKKISRDIKQIFKEGISSIIDELLKINE